MISVQIPRRKLALKLTQNVDAFVSKLCDISGPDVTQFWYNLGDLLRNYLWRCQTLLIHKLNNNWSGIWMIYGGYLWFWYSLEVRKMTVPLFKYSSNLKTNVTWRTPERRLSRATQSAFFAQKTVYILGHFLPKFPLWYMDRDRKCPKHPCWAVGVPPPFAIVEPQPLAGVKLWWAICKLWSAGVKLWGLNFDPKSDGG